VLVVMAQPETLRSTRPQPQPEETISRNNDVLLIALFLWLLGRQKKAGKEQDSSPNAQP